MKNLSFCRTPGEKVRLAQIVAVTLAVLFSASCLPNRYAAPIGKFRDRTQATVGVLSDFYDSRNDYEISLYLDSVAADPSVRLSQTDHGSPTPIGKLPFSEKSIKARLDSLDLIGAYANRLADLAGSQAPAKFKTAAELLGTNLTGLGETFSSLAGSGDPTANKYVTPVTALIGAIGQLVLETKRDRAISAAVERATPEVNTILNQMKSDFDTVFAPLIVTGEAERMSDLVKRYNVDKASLNFEQRQARLKQVHNALKGRSMAIAAVPSSLITGLSQSHEALVRAATSKSGRPKNFAELNAALEAWTSRIQYAATQIKALTI